MKGKKIGVIVLELFIILLGFTGVTLAVNKIFSDRATIGLKAGDFYIDYKGNQDIIVNNLEPISDNKINADTHDNVIRIDFSLRGMKENDDVNIIYDVIMSDMNIDCNLLNEYTKWNLYKDGNLLSSGNMSSLFDGDVYNNYLKITNIQEDLPKYNENYDNYTFIMWISESCNDINNCIFVDQSNILDSNISFKVFVALYVGSKKENVRVPNYDKSCVRKPKLYNSMVPVYYSDGKVIKADKKNSDKNNLWYSYSEKKWANSVVLKEDHYNIGDIISDTDILAYYVWIPKYSYKVWNINNDINYEAYDAYEKGIDIKFSDGTIKCTNNRCDGENLDYYTHPAFDDITGFWVSKYELSNSVKFVPNKEAYTSSNIKEFVDIFHNIPTTYNFGNKVSSDIVNNLEWGAITYLSHSKYGNINIMSNNSYISGDDINDSTTGNMYGVFDMSGGASEFVYSNNSIGSATQEILLDNNTTWNNNYYEHDTPNSYYIRGGLQRGIYSYSTYNESSPLISARNILKEKSS